MSVLERFTQYLGEQALCQPHERILLAVSGGKDSVLMTHLFAEAGFAVGIAHCNFQLRGEEADADQTLVYKLAKALDAPFYATAFDTEAHARHHGISIQMAARELRYEWFETIRASQGYDYIAVAQHQNDHVETLLLNLVRGTGLAGLQGIQPKRGNIIRPLLLLSAEEVTDEVNKRKLEYRDDSSNFSTKYARNKIRLEVIPQLKMLNPSLEHTLAAEMARFADAHKVLQSNVTALRDKLFTEEVAGEWHIPTAELVALEPQRFLLYELFKPFGFTEAVLGDLAKALQGVPGKRFFSRSYVLFLDRDEVVLKLRKANGDKVAIIEKPGDRVQWDEYHFRSDCVYDTRINEAPHIAQFDADLMVFPIQVRSWQEADAFWPLGMNGRKKLSDFFVSLKIPIYRKHNVPVIVNGNGDIIWVAPYRQDNRYKITGKTKKVFTLACS